MDYKLQRVKRKGYSSCGGVSDGDRREDVYNYMGIKVQVLRYDLEIWDFVERLIEKRFFEINF